jgi:hypothetical protein
MELTYQICDATNRANTNLTLFRREIVDAVHVTLPNFTVAVGRSSFKISGPYHPYNFSLRKLGKIIAEKSNYLASIRKFYGNSTQIFRRKD